MIKFYVQIIIFFDFIFVGNRLKKENIFLNKNNSVLKIKIKKLYYINICMSYGNFWRIFNK